MSSRARGDHDSSYMRRWRPRHPATDLPRWADQHSTTADPNGPVPASSGRPATAIRRRKSRAARRAIVAVIVLIIAGAAYASQRPARVPTRVDLPTPRAWLAAYMSAAVDNPSRVCRVLFARELATRYGPPRQGSCAPRVSTVEARRVRIRRIVQANGTAVIELRHTHHRHAWDIVLTRHGSGWQAMEVISRP